MSSCEACGERSVTAGNERGLRPEGSRATKVGCMKSNILKSPAVMSPIIRNIGLDVHKDTIAVAVAVEGAVSSFLKTISHDLHAVEKLAHELCDGCRDALRMCYEACIRACSTTRATADSFLAAAACFSVRLFLF